MKIKTGLLFLLLCSLSVLCIFGPMGCANIVAPLGGPKDTIPPVLVSAVPKDSAKKFTGNKIILNFNEYIDGKDLRTELLVSPVPKIDPLIDAKLRTVTIRLKDTLQGSTTYALYFNRGIKDVNEGNILHNFVMSFPPAIRSIGPSSPVRYWSRIPADRTARLSRCSMINSTIPPSSRTGPGILQNATASGTSRSVS